MKHLLCFLLMISHFSSFSQIDEEDYQLLLDIEKFHIDKQSNFYKACTFYFNRQIDSSFFYSSQAYQEVTSNTTIANYLSYIYGATALDKKFYALAQNELERISTSFKYKYLVDNRLGQISLHKKKYNKALNYYNAVLQTNKMKSKQKLKVLFHNIGLCHLHLKQYDQSETFLLKELGIAERDNDTLGIICAKVDIGNLFYEQYKDEKAITYFKSAYNLAQLFSSIKLKQNTAQNMAIVEKNRQHYKESVDYYNESIKWKDSLWNRDKISQLLEKDKQIAIAVKEKEISKQKELTEEQNKRINLFIVVIITILILLGALLFLYRIKIKQNQLINSQKEQLETLNSAKNYLFSVISHDLRSPVNTLKKQHNQLIQDISDNNMDHVKKTAHNVTSITEGMHHLLNNVLHWALEQSKQLFFNKRTAAINPIIQHVIFNFKTLAETKQIDLKTRLKDSVLVNIDTESFKIVLRNLIDNAIKYTPENGTVSIETKTNAENCFIEVKDSGVGISEDQLKRINALKEISIDKIDRSKGIGLGLLLCTTLIKKNGGKFDIESKPNHGTKMIVTLPMVSI